MLSKKVWKPFSTLILGEHNGKTLSKNTLKILSGASKFKEDVTLLLELDSCPFDRGKCQGCCN